MLKYPLISEALSLILLFDVVGMFLGFWKNNKIWDEYFSFKMIKIIYTYFLMKIWNFQCMTHEKKTHSGKG
jgi:hypothetical protein